MKAFQSSEFFQVKLIDVLSLFLYSVYFGGYYELFNSNALKVGAYFKLVIRGDDFRVLFKMLSEMGHLFGNERIMTVNSIGNF